MKKLTFSVIFCLTMLQIGAQVTFRIVSQPANTPSGSTLYLASNFNNWNAADANHVFRTAADGFLTLTVPTPTNRAMEFKITRGAWTNNEGNATGGFLANRTATATGGRDTINLTIASWQDLGASSGTRAANVTILNTAFSMPQLGRTRRIWLYLPPDYATSGRRYPVLYLHDGQNLFDRATSFSGEWEVDETLNRLFASGDRGCIVVGIDNDGAQRLNEYSPWTNPTYGGGQGAQYTRFIVETLKPYIDSNYRTRPERLTTGIGGSSMGGLISMYAAREFEATFSKILIFSPAFWFARSEARTHARMRPHGLPTKVYFLSGANESATMVSDMNAIRDSLAAVGFLPTQLQTVVRQDGQHSEWFWAREFGAGYQWLFSDLASATQQMEPKNKPFSDARLLPNPASNWVQIESESLKTNEKFELRLVNLTGKILIIQKNNPSLNIQNLPNGLFFVQIWRDDQLMNSLKLVKK